MQKDILYPNIPIACEYAKQFMSHEPGLDLRFIKLNPFIRAHYRIFRTPGSDPRVDVQAFTWSGPRQNGHSSDETEFDTLRRYIERKPEILKSQSPLVKRYFTELAGRVLCHACPLYREQICQPLLFNSLPDPSLLIVPQVSPEASVVRVDFAPEIYDILN
jgi:hypothetical protein